MRFPATTLLTLALSSSALSAPLLSSLLSGINNVLTTATPSQIGNPVTAITTRDIPLVDSTLEAVLDLPVVSQVVDVVRTRDLPLVDDTLIAVLDVPVVNKVVGIVKREDSTVATIMDSAVVLKSSVVGDVQALCELFWL